MIPENVRKTRSKALKSAVSTRVTDGVYTWVTTHDSMLLCFHISYIHAMQTHLLMGEKKEKKVTHTRVHLESVCWEAE